MSFPLKDRAVGGYTFGEPTFYNAHHIGVDYHAPEDTPLYAPFAGVIQEAFSGIEGGKTIWFKPDHDNVIIRFLHLDRFLVKKGDRVEEGAEIALTGNTGKLTTGPHLHLDTSRGSVNLSWPGNFVDPEQYAWDTVTPPQEPIPVPIIFWVTVDAPAGSANFRKEPSLSGAVMVTYKNGEQIECSDTVDGEEVTVHNPDGSPRTSNKWYQSKKHGWYIAAVVSKHN